ncbi:MAG: PQQ-binding-like beta-propeller repeat protein [Bacteroidetes bacterium]|nr:PQQ-binding-like beta-propeller repeat protein [Bacteroidota bacterium]
MEKIYRYILIGLSLLICSHLFSQTYPQDFTTIPIVKWKFKSTQPFISTPVIEGNLVYVGCLDSCLYVLDLKSGKEKWKFKTGGGIRSTVSILDNKIFFNSFDGNLYCLEKSDGKVIWTFKASDKQYDINDYHQSSPVVHNNIIYFGMGDGNMYAVNVSDGSKVWSYHTEDVVHSTPAILDDKIYFGSFDGNVYGLNLSDGSLIWKFKTVGHNFFPKGEVQFSPNAIGKTVYIAARDYNLYAIDKDKGVCRWNREFTPGWATEVSWRPDRDSIIYLSTSDPKNLFAIHRAYETTKWSTELKTQCFANCAFSQNMCYLGTVIGKFFAIDLYTGKIKWTFSTEGYNKYHLNYFKPDDDYRDNIIDIVKDDEGFQAALDKCGAIYSTAAITDNEIIFSSSEGNVYCLGR